MEGKLLRVDRGKSCIAKIQPEKVPSFPPGYAHRLQKERKRPLRLLHREIYQS